MRYLVSVLIPVSRSTAAGNVSVEFKPFLSVIAMEVAVRENPGKLSSISSIMTCRKFNNLMRLSFILNKKFRNVISQQWQANIHFVNDDLQKDRLGMVGLKFCLSKVSLLKWQSVPVAQVI